MSDSSEEELRRVLQHRTSPWAALQRGAGLAAQTAVPGLVVVGIYGVVGGLGLDAAMAWGEGLLARGREPEPLLLQVLVGIAAFLALYTVIQFVKRDRVSRSSWLPSLFLTPVLCLTGALAAVGSQLPPMAVPAFTGYAWELLFESFVGGAAVYAWLRLGADALDGRSPDVPGVLADLPGRLLDVAVVHGARFHAVAIGMQVIIPGIFYALQLAFADMLVVLDPERPSLRRSGQLTFGMRGRIFRLLLTVWVTSAVLTSVVVVLVDGAPEGVLAAVLEPLLNPSAPGTLALVLQRLISGLLGWIALLALLVLYREREAQVSAKRALRDLASPDAGALAYKE